MIDRLARKRAFDTLSGTEEEKFAQGKLFANYYECFLCATVLGIRQNYRFTTFLTPPLGLGTSPVYRGMMWMLA
ncbi:hypothetical protein [Fibrella aquatica]|jgi:hypothetical protein|uniref:hypothetical protein n=1 Tax=Fibrella aquatica TaxID=3242487 RepID=UPI0035226366